MMSINVPPYSKFEEEVNLGLAAADQNQVNWFTSNELRARIYKIVASSGLSPKETVNFIFKNCTTTAPIAITQIAPESSYMHKIDSIMGMWETLNLDKLTLYPDIKIGIKSFKECLEKPVELNQGFSILCNLYKGEHCFVIEKRSNDCCYLFQSYLSFKLTDISYDYTEFLKDESKHVAWDPKTLITFFSNFVAGVSDSKTQKIYKELFHNNMNSDYLDFLSLSKYPLIFVETSPYTFQR